MEQNMEGKTVYFSKPGIKNTEEVLRIAKHRAEELGIKTILVASNNGYTATRAVKVFEGMRVVVVRSLRTGSWTNKDKKKVESKGGIVYSGTHVFQGLDTAVRWKFDMHLTSDIVTNTLRIFSEGIKVVCEISMMATDAGLVNCDEDIIVIAGTHRGADTAVVLRPVHTTDFFDLRIKELLCKPYLSPPHASAHNRIEPDSLYGKRTKMKSAETR